jgi:hypothetical protein
MNFIVYQTSDGCILRTGQCDAADLASQALPGQVAIEGIADDRTQYIKDGVVTARPPSLADVKVTQIALLTAAYTMAIQQPVPYMSTSFQADMDSQTKVVQVLAAMTPVGATPAGFYWVDAANNHVSMTLAQVQGLAQVMMDQGWAAFQNLQTRKAAVAAATTIEDVQAVTW